MSFSRNQGNQLTQYAKTLPVTRQTVFDKMPFDFGNNVINFLFYIFVIRYQLWIVKESAIHTENSHTCSHWHLHYICILIGTVMNWSVDLVFYTLYQIKHIKYLKWHWLRQNILHFWCTFVGHLRRCMETKRLYSKD